MRTNSVETEASQSAKSVAMERVDVVEGDAEMALLIKVLRQYLRRVDHATLVKVEEASGFFELPSQHILRDIYRFPFTSHIH